MTASSSTSRLFHAVVVVGINLGASAGCGGLATGPGDAPASAQPSGGTTGSSGTGATPDASADAIGAAFCDVPWPTTKGNNTVLTTPLPPCVDPTSACSETRIDTVGPCIPVQADGCRLESTFHYPNCRAGAWVCPPTTASSTATPVGPCACPGQFRGSARCADGAWEQLP